MNDSLGLQGADVLHAPVTAVPTSGLNNVFFRVCPEANTVIVFVHGILSDSRSCWLRESGHGSVYWPSLICSDPFLNNISIFLGGYEASFDAGQAGVREGAQRIMNEMRLQRDFRAPLEYEKIVFVCHSTGGLVVRYLLVA